VSNTQAVDMWTMRWRAPAAGPWTGASTRLPTVRRLRPHDHRLPPRL